MKRGPGDEIGLVIVLSKVRQRKETSMLSEGRSPITCTTRETNPVRRGKGGNGRLKENRRSRVEYVVNENLR